MKINITYFVLTESTVLGDRDMECIMADFVVFPSIVELNQKLMLKFSN